MWDKAQCDGLRAQVCSPVLSLGQYYHHPNSRSLLLCRQKTTKITLCEYHPHLSCSGTVLDIQLTPCQQETPGPHFSDRYPEEGLVLVKKILTPLFTSVK